MLSRIDVTLHPKSVTKSMVEKKLSLVISIFFTIVLKLTIVLNSVIFSKGEGGLSSSVRGLYFYITYMHKISNLPGEEYFDAPEGSPLWVAR